MAEEYVITLAIVNTVTKVNGSNSLSNGGVLVKWNAARNYNFLFIWEHTFAEYMIL